MKIADVCVLLSAPAILRSAWLIRRACNPTWEVVLPGHFDHDDGHGEQSSGEWLRHIHGLDSGELNAPLLPKQHSRLHSKVTVVVEPETERPPLKVVQRCDGSTQQKGDDGEDNDGERDGWHPREADDVV